MAGSDDLNNANKIKALDNEHIAQTYGRFDVVLSYGKGCQVWDFDGKRYLDMTSGIGVNSFGFCDDEWQKAITSQLGKLQHTSNLYFTEPSVRLANLLIQKSGLQKAFFVILAQKPTNASSKPLANIALTNMGRDDTRF